MSASFFIYLSRKKNSLPKVFQGICNVILVMFAQSWTRRRPGHKAQHESSLGRNKYKMAANSYQNEMRRYFENNSRTKDIVAHTAKVGRKKRTLTSLCCLIFIFMRSRSRHCNLGHVFLGSLSSVEL